MTPIGATPAARRHAQKTELAMEDRAAGREIHELAERLAAKDRRVATFLRALVDAQTEGAALRALIQARADHIVEVSAELAGLLEVGEPAMFRKSVTA
jgi:cell division septum initiation protein DivIVA